LGVTGVGVEFGGRGEAGDELVEILEVPSAAEGEIGYLGFGYLRVDIGAVGLQGDGGAFDDDAFGDAGDLEAGVDPAESIRVDADAALDDGAKGGRGDGELLGAGLEIVKEVNASLVGRALLGDSGGDIDSLHFCAGYGSVGRIGHGSGQRPVQDLRG